MPDLQRQAEETWTSAYALRNDNPANTRAFNQFEMLLSMLNMTEVSPCPAPWCDESETHAWTYELHHPTTGMVGRRSRRTRIM